MTTTISRLYNSYTDAEAAVRNLETAGIPHGDISILASNADSWYTKTGKPETYLDRNLNGVDDHKEGGGTGTGAGVGAAVGGTAGLLAGLGIMAIPGVGPVVAAGWLVSTLAGLAAGGATGGVIGALSQSGVNKEDADVYAEGLRRGGAVVSARVPDTDAARYQAMLDRGAVNIKERATSYRSAGWNKFDPNAGPYDPDQVRKDRALYR